jgi:hypothetical protein
MNVTITWGDILIHLAIEIVVGLSVSFLFLRYILYYLRPRVKISPEIAFEEENGTFTYWFKIVNQSRWEAFDLDFTLECLTMEATGSMGYNLKHVRIVELHRSKFSTIAGYQSDRNIKKHKSSAPHCFQVRTHFDIKDLLKDHKYFIRLHVTLKHGLSGICKSFEQQFTHTSRIEKGAFAFGNQYSVEKC